MGGNRGARGGSRGDVPVGGFHHSGFANPAGENPEGAEVVLQGGGGEPAVFPGFRQGLHMLAPEAVDRVELVTELPEELEPGVQHIGPLVARGMTGHRAVHLGGVVRLQHRRQTGFPTTGSWMTLTHRLIC